MSKCINCKKKLPKMKSGNKIVEPFYCPFCGEEAGERKYKISTIGSSNRPYDVNKALEDAGLKTEREKSEILAELKSGYKRRDEATISGNVGGIGGIGQT